MQKFTSREDSPVPALPWRKEITPDALQDSWLKWAHIHTAFAYTKTCQGFSPSQDIWSNQTWRYFFLPPVNRWDDWGSTQEEVALLADPNNGSISGTPPWIPEGLGSLLWENWLDKLVANHWPEGPGTPHYTRSLGPQELNAGSKGAGQSCRGPPWFQEVRKIPAADRDGMRIMGT